MSSSPDTLQQIAQIVKSEPVVLFMKGNRSFPQCGFSATVVQILNGLVPEYKTVNVLSDPAIRQGIKDYSKWPTIPQLYVGGEFVGGCDIVREMYAAGDLQKKLGVDAGSVEPPSITVTPLAAEKLAEALADAEANERIHVSVDAKFRAQLGFAVAGPAFLTVQSGGVELLVDPASAPRADGMTIDYRESSDRGPGFKIDNPNAPSEVVELAPAELASKLEAGEVSVLYDVRTPEERDRAVIDGSVLLDNERVGEIEKLDRDTPLAFYCHVGQRSRAAAEHFRELGFKKVYNLAGGITAWSAQVDPSVPTY
jgi:monothiol glutaredoxin